MSEAPDQPIGVLQFLSQYATYLNGMQPFIKCQHASCKSQDNGDLRSPAFSLTIAKAMAKHPTLANEDVYREALVTALIV